LQDSQPTLKSDVKTTVAWAIVTPALAVWPFLSALPAFTLIGGAGDPVTAGVALLLFLSGFWGVASLFVFMAFISTERARAARIFDRRGKGLKIGTYALIWTAIYFVLRFGLGL
jgi:hypothetical protein